MHSPDETSRTALYLDQLKTACPDLAIVSAEANFSGQFNDILIVNGAWIFRFPRYAEGVAALQAETRLLAELRGRLPLPIPDPVYAHFDSPEAGQTFMGYRRLPGEPLFRDRLAAMRDEGQRERLAGQLAGFLAALHRLPWQGMGFIPASPADEPAEWAIMYRDVREKLFPAMRPDARRQVAEHFERYLSDPGLHDFAPALRHGDFGGSNILFDPACAVICGVIDFSFCAPGDAAADLASVSTLGEEFFQRILIHYPADEEQRGKLAARARFYRGTFALMEALDGLRLGDARAFESGMEGYI